MKRYAVELSDGTLAITTVIETTIEEVLRKTKWPDNQTVLSYREIELSNIPYDRTYRNAWKHKEGKVEVDMPKARKIHMDWIRERRNKLLEESDKEWLKATTKKDTAKVTQIETEKQRLRDLPQVLQSSVDNAKTPEELKVIGNDL